MESTFEASIPGTALGVRMVRSEMTAMATGCGMDADAVADVRLAVTEAAANAVMHAYAETEGELTVSAVARDGELEIVICDAGAGFVEDRDSPGLGVGMSIIATVAGRLSVVSNPDGTEIHMAFPCPNAV